MQTYHPYLITLEKIVDSVKEKTEDESLSESSREECSEIGLHGLFYLSLFDRMEKMPEAQKNTFFKDVKPEIERYIELCRQVHLPA